MTTRPILSTSRTRMTMMVKTMPTKGSARDDDELYERVAQILEQAKGQVARSVNTAMVRAYWLVGREIVEVEQAGEQRAGYGQNVIERLSTRLQGPFGKGFSVRNLWNMRQFYRAFPRGSALAMIPRTASAESGRGIPQTPSARSRLFDHRVQLLLVLGAQVVIDPGVTLSSSAWPRSRRTCSSSARSC